MKIASFFLVFIPPPVLRGRGVYLKIHNFRPHLLKVQYNMNVSPKKYLENKEIHLNDLVSDHRRVEEVVDWLCEYTIYS